MFRKTLTILAFMPFTLALAATPDAPPSLDKLSAAEIVEKNVSARGGLQAWRSVETMSMEGKMGVGGNRRAALPVPVPTRNNRQEALPQRPAEEVQLPFVMELKRPRKMRLQLQFNGQTSVQVYDGTNGWKARPFLNRGQVEPYTADEIKMASIQADLDGLLVDYTAKGTTVDLDGTDKVEDRDTYRLKLTLKNGQAIHVWVDAETFLETKIEGQPRRLDGTYHPVEVYYRDYRQVSGLQIPFVLETRVLPVAKTSLGFKDTPVPAEKITIDKVAVNPQLDDSHFSKPDVGRASKTE